MKLNKQYNKLIFKNLKGTIYLFLFLLVLNKANAQKYNLTIISDSINSEKFLKKKAYDKVFNDSLSLFSELEAIKSKLFAKGYISASFDSVIFDSARVTAYLFTGIKYKLQEINIQEIDKQLLRKLNISEKKIKANKIKPHELLDFYNKIITYYENNAYPFAIIIPEKVEVIDNNIKLNLLINRSKQVKINKIIIKGNPKLSEIYIKRYLSLFENDDYNENIISSINLKIEELSFLSQIRKPEIEFYGNNADVYLYLKNKKANLFNGVVGFIPVKNNDYKLSFTGEIDFRLLNNFTKGEEIYLKWNRTEKLSQKLNVGTNIPFLFKSPFGLNTNFKLDKRDTTFMSVFGKAGIDYSFKNNDKIIAYAKVANSFILSSQNIDTTIFKNVKSTLFGIAYETKNIDYIYNPSKGFFLYSDIASGNRKLANSTYSFLDLKLKFDYYLRLFGKFVLKSSLKNNYMFSESQLFQNEMYKIGGFNSVRGFDEDAFFTSGFSMLSGDLRYLFERNSNVYAFIDYARIKQIDRTINLTGFGFGTNFNTKAGIFSIAYALGKQGGNSVLLSNSKIHLGYVNRF
ncbi:MAG: hypothetical protein L3J35_00105 [Bacteroidales bacterium]|nr:hypothetical protein [Bacteroidales bacterium]